MKLNDNIIAAAGFATFNAVMLAGMSLSAKLLSDYFDPIEVTFWRNVASLILLMGFFAVIGHRSFHETKRPWAHLFRGTIGTIGIALGMWTVSILPLAETTVLLFTSPLFTVLLSALVLRENIGPYRYGAVAIGFVGVAIMAGPMGSIPIIGLLAGLGWGFCSGAVDATLRWMGETEKSETTVFYFLLLGTIACGLYWPFSQTPVTGIAIDEAWHVIAIITALGLTGTLALLSKTQSYRLGEASLIAPIMYTMLIWSVLFDYLFWERIPGWNVILGASIIVAANLFILWREQLKKRKPQT